MLQPRPFALRPELVSVRCTWKPGSFDTVKVQAGDHRLLLKLYAMHRMFGVQAVNDLFLSGLFCTTVGQQTVQALLSEASAPGMEEKTGTEEKS